MNNENFKVLLVDDDRSILRLSSLWLRQAGFQVEQAGDGVAAIAALERSCPDFLITDWEMPVVDGLQLCRHVRQLDLPHYLHIIFATQRCNSEDIILGLEAGADDFLTKPLQKGELLARLRSGMRILELESRLSQLARTDALTGILTQRSFHDIFEAEWSRASRYQLPLSCVMLDIDFFKRINDTFGHSTGDAVIRAVADLMANNCRLSDTICRYGGEEFCAILPETNESQAAIWAERLRRAVASAVLHAEARNVSLTASFGVAERREGIATPRELIDLADQALRAAKQSGRDCVVEFSSLSGPHPAPTHVQEHAMPLAGVLAKHVMTALGQCLDQDQLIEQAVEFLSTHRVNSAPVVDGNRKLVGIISEKDLFKVMLVPEAQKQPIREVMKRNVVSYDENTPALVIYDFLARVTLRRVVVVKGDVPTGVISRGSLLHWMTAWSKTRLLHEKGPTGTKCVPLETQLAPAPSVGS